MEAGDAGAQGYAFRGLERTPRPDRDDVPGKNEAFQGTQKERALEKKLIAPAT